MFYLKGKKFLSSAFILTISLYISVSNANSSLELKQLMHYQNTVRVEHNLPTLTWSNNLAHYAQQWVDHLATQQNCEMQHRPEFGLFKQQYGENLFWASPKQMSDGRHLLQQYSARHIIESWAEEKAFYDYASNSCQSGQVCGHYTQMVWWESREIGCAMTICPNQQQLWACNYHPRGNYIGERPY